MNAQGRFWLEAVHLWLGQENGQVALYDAHGNRLGGFDETAVARQQAEQRAAQAEQQATESQQRATQAEQQVTQAQQEATQAKQRMARLTELIRKVRRGLASQEDLLELDRLEEQLPPS